MRETTASRFIDVCSQKVAVHFSRHSQDLVKIYSDKNHYRIVLLCPRPTLFAALTDNSCARPLRNGNSVLKISLKLQMRFCCFAVLLPISLLIRSVCNLHHNTRMYPNRRERERERVCGESFAVKITINAHNVRYIYIYVRMCF